MESKKNFQEISLSHYYEFVKDLRSPAIRSEEYKLIYFYTVNEWELYDLKKILPNKKISFILRHTKLQLNN